MSTVVFIVLLIFGVNIYYGIRYGFVRMIVPLLSNVVSIFLLVMTKQLWKDVMIKWVFAEMSLIIARIVVLILLYVIILGIIKLIVLALKMASMLPVLHFMDKVLGVVTGVIAGLLWVWLFLAIVYVFRDNAAFIYFVEQAKENAFVNFLYEHNLIAYLVGEFV